MASRHMVLLSCFVFLAALHGIQAVHYAVTNNAGSSAGGVRFTNEIGIPYSRQTLVSATDSLWTVFQQNTPAERKTVQKVSLIIESMDGVAYASNNEIHWNGNGQAPGGLIEGIADFVRLKANYAPSHWVQPGQGDRWDQDYDVTARFLDNCNSLRNGCVSGNRYYYDYLLRIVFLPKESFFPHIAHH
ncbi:hypothetical protein CK203_032040 [Vitis vinifera]|uniref:Uncharacterized protein n=1 Tax=Vitis vinifera TaxID=29760 RepID=A0A438FNA4_VITVI|nr:hypothetical protein CK203_032040 [Vitis vinifera]